MKTLCLLVTALTLSACASVAVNAAVATSPVVARDASETSADASVQPVASAHAREPEALPAEFAAHAMQVDVDHDGHDDLVRDLRGAIYSDDRADSVDAVLVAHRLADGRYAVDDDVTRASLRAMCPASPTTVAYTFTGPATVEQRMGERALFYDGLCARAWGATMEESERRVREIAAASTSGFFTPSAVDQIVAALRETPMALTLSTIAPATLPTLPATRATAMRPAAPSVDGPCRAVLANNERVLSSGRRLVPVGAALSGDQGVFEPLIDVGATCAATARGMWSIWLQRINRDVHGDVDVPATLAWRASTRGARSSRPRRIAYRGNGGEAREVHIVTSGDIDGDGVDELVVRNSRRAMAGQTSSDVSVFTVRGGDIVPYEPAQGLGVIVDATDFDGDGRLDLVLADRAVGSTRFPDRRPPNVLSLAHALADGTFSRSDEVARRYGESRCVQGESDDDSAYRSVLCAAQGGASREPLVASLAERVALPTTVRNFGELGARVEFFRRASSALFRPWFAPSVAR